MREGFKHSRRQFMRGAATAATSLCMPGARLAHAATAIAADGTKLFHEVTGNGRPIIFLHETARTYRSLDLQVAALKDSFQCIAYNARGYPPSDVPGSLASYSQDIAAADVEAVLDARGLRDAHIVGVSMGSAVALQLALRNGRRVRSLVLCSIGAGSDLKPGEFAANIEAAAERIEASGGSKLGDILGGPPDRQRLKQKRPTEFEEFIDQASGLSPIGLANTYRGVVKPRPPIYTYKDQIAAMKIPTLVVVGALDAPCLNASQFLAHTIGGARLEILPATGHSVNVEEPAIINRLVADFVGAAESQ